MANRRRTKDHIWKSDVWRNLVLVKANHCTVDKFFNKFKFYSIIVCSEFFVHLDTRVIYLFSSTVSQLLVPRSKTKWTTVNVFQCFASCASCHVDAHTCPQLATYEEERNSNKRHPGFRNAIQLCEAILCHSNKSWTTWSVFMWVDRKENFVRLVFTFKNSRIYIIYLSCHLLREIVGL